MALSMLAKGTENESLQELLNLLQIDSEDRFLATLPIIQDLISKMNKNVNGFEFASANGVYTDNKFPLKHDFIQTIMDNFQGKASKKDFMGDTEGARQLINQEIAQQTKEMIPELIPSGSVSANTVLVLANAVYFKASWLQTFDHSKTSDQDFYTDSEQKRVSTMFLSGFFRMQKFEDVTLLEVPYDVNLGSSWTELPVNREDWDVSMVILLPHDGKSIDNIDLEKYSKEAFKSIQTTQKKMVQKVDLYLPKFEIIYDNGSMKSTLESLGVNRVFNPTSAQLGGISNSSDGLFVSDIFHKSKIIVNEEGTEAVAASAVVEDFESAMSGEEIRVNRPFAFMVVYKPAASILFMGKVSDPSNVQTGSS